MFKITSLKDAAALFDQMVAEGEPTDAKGRTRARILRAAVALFQERGYRRTSVDEVAREAGVAKGTVYLHFKDKSELMLHALMEEKKVLARPFRPLLTDPMEPKTRLLRYLELMLVAINRAPLTRRLMSGDREVLLFIEELPAETRALLRGNQAAATQELLKGVGGYDALSEEERERRATVLNALIYSSAQLMDPRLRGGMDELDYVQTLARTIVEGIGVP